MKRILVYDVAAVYGGAYAVLHQYYQKALHDKNNEYYFIVSKLQLSDKANVHVIKLPWVKKSWFHRLFCDYIYMPQLLKKIPITEILSLQNMGISRCKIFQTVYVHNAIPFTEYKFHLRKDFYLWIYQNVIGRMTYRSLKRADKILVQNEWMQDAVAEKCQIPKEKIAVEKITVNIYQDYQRTETDKVIFFYPAQPFRFKNHQAVLSACKELVNHQEFFEVVFTFAECESRLAKKYKREIKKYHLPVRLTEYLNKNQMKEYYQKSVLLFPSYLETAGLPLLEAKAYGAQIIAADCRYAQSVLCGYEDVCYFHPDDSHDLAGIMKTYIEKLISEGKYEE